MKDSKISILNKTKKGTIPKVPFLELKNSILGKNYELSIAFVDEKTSRVLNKNFRGKDKPTNILSFELTKTSGEIVLCPVICKKEAPDFEKSYTEFIGYLLIHGMLHLKGMEHGSTMEKKEREFSKKFSI